MNIRGRLRFLRGVLNDVRTPWYAKALIGALVLYLVSPIDIIPDFIPVVGYLDDAIIAVLGLLLVMALVPPAVLEDHRQSEDTRK